MACETQSLDVVQTSGNPPQGKAMGMVSQQRLASVLSTSAIACVFASGSAVGQSIVPANDGTGTAISSPADNPNQIDIGGGTRVDTNLFHSFQRFGLSEGEIANFISEQGIENILGRVTGGDASFIDGLIQMQQGDAANLFLMNPAGIVFGPDSRVDLGGDFTATTATGIQLNEAWFKALGENSYADLVGNPSAFAFTGEAGTILNAGELEVAAGHGVRLLGGSVINTGTVEAPGGEIVIEAVPGEGLVSLTQSGSLLSLGLPVATQAALESETAAAITPVELPRLLANPGLTPAAGVTVEDGVVKLTGATSVAVPDEAGVAIASGTLDAGSDRRQGGQIDVLGQKVGVVGAILEASGETGGGAIRIGGDYKGQGIVQNAGRTVIDSASSVRADAQSRGDGGSVVVWADGATQFSGDISARGGREAGSGGFVEVSGKETLAFRGIADVTAPHGLDGTLLLDPERIRIVSGSDNVNDGALADGQISFDETDGDGTFTISETVLESLSGNVVLEATEEIVIEDLADDVLALNRVDSILFNVQSEDFSVDTKFTVNDGKDLIQTQDGDIGIVAEEVTIGSITTNGGDIALGSDLTDGNISIIERVSGYNEVTLLSAGSSTILSTNGGSVEFNGEIEGESDSNPVNVKIAAGTGDIYVRRLANGFSSAGPSIRDIRLIGEEIEVDGASWRTAGNIDIQATGNLDLNSSVSAGSSLNFSARSFDLPGNFVLTAGDSIKITSQEDLTLGEFARLDSGADTTVAVKSGSLTLESFNSGGDIAPENIALSASENLNIEGSMLSTTGDLTLSAEQQVTLKDGGLPLLLNATNDIQVQGNSGIRIEGYRYPESEVNAGRNLILISDGPISVDGNLNQGGSFVAEDTAGSPADLTASAANFVGRISASGDITFGDYQGPSLRIEAGGSITGGDILIFSPNPNIQGSEADINLSTELPSVFLSAGVENLAIPENAPLEIAAGGTVFSANTTPSSPAEIRVGDINTRASDSQSGPIRLTAPGNVTTGNLSTEELIFTPSSDDEAFIEVITGGDFIAGDLISNGDDVTVQANGNIKVDTIHTNGFGTISGVTLKSETGDIEISTIDTGSGGVDITAAGMFRATGNFTTDFNPLVTNDPGLRDYLESPPLNYDLGETNVSLDNIVTARVSILARPSEVAPGKTYPAPIFIRMGDQAVIPPGGNQIPDTEGEPGRILVLTDSKTNFRSGATFDGNPLYKPAQPTDRIEDFHPEENNFRFTLTPGEALESGTEEFPLEANGLAGGIAIGSGSNTSLYASVQNQSLDAPTPPPPPTPPTPTPPTPPTPTPPTPTPPTPPTPTPPTPPTPTPPTPTPSTPESTTPGASPESTDSANGDTVAQQPATASQLTEAEKAELCEQFETGGILQMLEITPDECKEPTAEETTSTPTLETSHLFNAEAAAQLPAPKPEQHLTPE